MTQTTSPLGSSWASLADAVDSAATGIEIPPGEPADLRRAATTWAHCGEELARQRRILNRAALTGALAGWTGAAALSFLTATQQLGGKLQRGAAACRRAAVALKQFATALDHAQDEARRAIAQAKEAIERIEAAKRKITGAAAAADAAETKAAEARAMADTARGVAGPLGEAGAQEAERRERAARSEGQAACAARRRAEALLDDAEADLRRARRRGREANDDARDAARNAARVLADVAAAANMPPPHFGFPPPGLAAGSPPGPLGEALANLGASLKDGKVTIGGTTVDLPPNALDVSNAGNDALQVALANAARRALDARMRTLEQFLNDPANPLMRGPYADVTRERLRDLERRDAARNPGAARKWLGNISRLAKKLAPPLQFYDNHKKGMPLVENGLRTGLSTAAGNAAAGAGVVCGPGAIVCAPLFGFAGSKLGDLGGGLLYDAGDLAWEKGIKPLGGELVDLAEDGVEGLKNLVGID